MQHPDGSEPRHTPGIQDVASARVSVEIEGMVKGMTRQIWIDAGAWTAKMAAEIEKQAAAIDLDALIATTVADALESQLQVLRRSINDKIKGMITEAIRGKLGAIPEMPAPAPVKPPRKRRT